MQKMMVFKIILVSLSAHHRERTCLYFKPQLSLGISVPFTGMYGYSTLFHKSPSFVTCVSTYWSRKQECK